MTKQHWGELVYGLLFLVWLVAFELPGHLGWTPWPTLSRTDWNLEHQWRPLYTLNVGVWWGLSFHLAGRVNLWVALAAGLALAVVSHVAWGWPRW